MFREPDGGCYTGASMRPPDLPGGNPSPRGRGPNGGRAGFNEAAGFTRRKHREVDDRDNPGQKSFNEAAGFTRRKLVPAPVHVVDLVGFNEAAGFTRRKRAAKQRGAHVVRHASMRPPDLPGGNVHRAARDLLGCRSFNEAAGFTRRKLRS